MKRNTYLTIWLIMMTLCLWACSKGKATDGAKNDTSHKPAMTADKGKMQPDGPQAEADQPFGAQMLDGALFDSARYQDQRLILGFFSIKHKDAMDMLIALKKLKPFEQKYNFKIFLVNIDYNDRDKIGDFLKIQQIDFPVILEDAALKIAERFNVEHEVCLVGLSAKDHKPSFGIKRYAFSGMAGGEKIFLDYLRENLSIKAYDARHPELGTRPAAPEFTAKTVDGKEIKLSSYRGKAVIVLFFSPRCPHCQHEMKFLNEKIYPEFKLKGLEVIAVSAVALEGEEKKLYDSFKYTWPIIADPKREIRKLFSDEGAVPENFVIDRQGLIRLHGTGYSENMDNNYLTLLRDILGIQNQPQLDEKKYSGVDACAICHQKEYTSWAVTRHARAWRTLEIRGEDVNPACVGCHTVGFNTEGGFKSIKNPKTGEEIVRVPPWFQNVTCENCHDRGGPHVSKKDKTAQKEATKKSCVSCHTPKFSPDFDLEKSLVKINHSDANAVMQMSLEDRVKLLEE
ncbi:MAG: redoxin domain-containing protein [Deltaproteobacteria bacterium]|nr:redoxin domain-containing protein [Deltaproteobacteria bacterium]